MPILPARMVCPTSRAISLPVSWQHARGICAVLAPLVNSYKRLVPGYEAPVYVSWAHTNRSALIRVPKLIPNRPQSSRIELRCPDPSCNPYLAFAVMLHAGLDGIRRELEPPLPLEENLYEFDPLRLQREQVEQLPGSLGDALDALATSGLGARGAGRPCLRAIHASQAARAQRVSAAGNGVGNRSLPGNLLMRCSIRTIR